MGYCTYGMVNMLLAYGSYCDALYKLCESHALPQACASAALVESGMRSAGPAATSRYVGNKSLLGKLSICFALEQII
ncbi:hypothetical protein GCM10023317_88020 [Actinopolymorpha pittospori]